MKIKSIDAVAKAVAALEALTREEILPVPPGWFTVVEYAKSRECAAATARSELRRLVSANLALRKTWHMLDVDGRKRQVKIFRVK